ncbi:hypothetical protein [Oleiharenicola lentus]|uniref:hypothetical protein n=1 Tax=Oleiharenicola lentus TaxID=2508720 RepID=UPI003F672FC2
MKPISDFAVKMPMHLFFARTLRCTFGAVLCAIVLTLSAHAAVGGFSATLSNDQQLDAGITLLTIEQRTALDRFVANELGQIKSGKVEEFDGSFVSRRSDDELKTAGLTQLSASQLTKLNEYAAAILDYRAPRERPRLKDSDVFSAKRKPEVHGEVTLAYGWGSGGREMRAGSMYVNYYDPASRVGIGIGVSQIEGDGFFGYPGYGFNPWGWGSRYYLNDPFYWGPSYFDTGPGRYGFADDDYSVRHRYRSGAWRR